MYNATMSHGRAKRVNAYLSKDILDASPQKLLIKVYDYAITNCRKNDMLRTNKALGELINSLNFESSETKEFSLGLMSLYQFCQDQMRKGKNEIVEKILMELRVSWLDIFSKEK
ncbi:MAG: flagellar protein FliS [Ignavibacteriales bacterium CG18_big_fil_WC_8_21_14_2_50_31_20]|nr:MAG: flagellar protein FliS [Ignavibacteriales bacterium CG18_big_fil_WC_8_21_14_2_50_31_20]